jgi:UDP-N-acetylmuramyl pentapeptide synthase
MVFIKPLLDNTNVEHDVRAIIPGDSFLFFRKERLLRHCSNHSLSSVQVRMAIMLVWINLPTKYE